MLTKTENIRKKIQKFILKKNKKNVREYGPGEATTKIWKQSEQWVQR